MAPKTTFLKQLNVHPSWKGFFTADIKEQLLLIEGTIGESYTPTADKVLRFATVDLATVKVVILGRDPYAKPNVATGRAFEVNGLTSWDDKATMSSLRNILKLIHKVYTKRCTGADIMTVRGHIQNRTFPILPPNELFTHWEHQGVLCLNTALTCKAGGIKQAGSHANAWKSFFASLLEYICSNTNGAKFFLWGQATKYVDALKILGVPEKNIYKSNHPSSYGDNRGYERESKFMNNPCFRDTRRVVDWIGTLAP